MTNPKLIMLFFLLLAISSAVDWRVSRIIPDLNIGEWSKLDLEFEQSASHIHHAVAKEDIEPAEWAFEYTKFLGNIKILRNPFLGPSGPRLDKSCIAPTNLGQLSRSARKVVLTMQPILEWLLCLAQPYHLIKAERLGLFMVNNGYLDPMVQMGLMEHINGCVEHTTVF